MDILELGCGINPNPTATVHHDKTPHHDYVNVAWDLDHLIWPWQDGQFDEIIAYDTMEHLKIDVDLWLSECHRILRPDGLLRLRLPAWNNAVSFRDPTHQRVFHPETFYYFMPGHELYENYGKVYWPLNERWWNVVSVDWVNPDYRYGLGDLLFVLKKLS